MEVKAPQIVNSEKWVSGYTLRFPRFVKLRRDKSWFEAMTLDQIKDLANYGGGRLTKRKYAEKQETGKKLKVEKNKATLLPQFLHTNMEGVSVCSELFKDLEFCNLVFDSFSDSFCVFLHP